MSGMDAGAWPGGIGAITLFVEDLGEAKRFYQDVFQLPVFHEDENSAVFRFGDTLVNLLSVSEAPALVGPAAVAPRQVGFGSSSRSALMMSTRCARSSNSAGSSY
jgi:catechol 2,3-dioxygenase-like lactoylglutathione lyase family enzyme